MIHINEEEKTTALILRRTDREFQLLVYKNDDRENIPFRFPGGGWKEIGFEKKDLIYFREIGRLENSNPPLQGKVKRHFSLFLTVKSRDKNNGILRRCEWIGPHRKGEIDREFSQIINPCNLPEFFMNPADFGLERNKIVLRETNPQWEKLYEWEEIQLRQALGEQNIRVNHVGSTAVKDFIAKPIIDILLEIVPGVDKEIIISGLETLGYKYKGANGIPGREYFTKGTENTTYFHLHAFEKNAIEAVNHKRVAALLNHVPFYKEQYRQYKLDNCHNNRLTYTQNKTSLMDSMLKSPEIRPLNQEEFEQGKKIIREYLPDQIEAYTTWFGKYGAHYLGCFLNPAVRGTNIHAEESLMGLAFGLPLEEMDPVQEEYFLLDGLAIKKEFRNLGYGSVLMDVWEETVFSSQPLKKISLGTEGESAVRFYRRRGYIPSGYLAFPDSKDFNKALFESHRSFRRYREKNGMILIYLNGSSFDQDEKQELKESLNLNELVILMEKVI